MPLDDRWRLAFLALALAGCGGSIRSAASDVPVCGYAQPTTLGTARRAVASLRVDATDVYWADEADGNLPTRLMRAPKSGGPSTILVGSGDIYFTLDDERVYYTSDSATGTALLALPKAGGPAVTLTSALEGSAVAWAEDATNIYVSAGALVSVPKAGGPPVTLSTGSDAMVFGVDDANVYWWTPGDGSGAPNGTINTAPKLGGPATQLARVPAYVRAAVLNAGTIYFTSYDPSALVQAVQQVPKAGGAVATLAVLVTPRTAGSYLATDGSALYTDEDTALVAIPYDGSPPRKTVASGGVQGFGGIAVDDVALYWGVDEEQSGAVMAGCK